MPKHHNNVPTLDIKPELLDELLKGSKTPGEINALLKSLKKAILERALGAELTHHLGYARGEDKPETQDNHRNGTTPKTVLTDDGALPIEVPRDRAGTFEPQIIGKGERRFTGFDDKIIAMYARGMSVREIQGYLEEIYGVTVSPDFISQVTDAVVEEVREWQVRPLEALYPVIFFDALRVKIRDEGTVKNKAVYLALGILPDGTKDILGIWIEHTEGAKFWLKVMTELKNRGVNDVLIAVVDGLKGFPEAIQAVFPRTQIQTCIVHLIRASLDYASWKDRKALATELKTIYRALDAEAARHALDVFDEGPWGRKYPPIAASWRRHWEEVIPFFAYPADVRKIIYTTNAIESLHMQLRKIIKTRGHFPNDDAATKLIYLALRNITKEWKMSAREWKSAMTQFAILFPERFVQQL
ncbi:MAG: IS256 family transposase [Sulfuricaulis sp.]